mmetsp:Transcript_126/g.475  ORF Transcript_126/g.475 Transcript_126/m.475 type:complete len:91 (+) Transcript_126:1673-1945(+)
MRNHSAPRTQKACIPISLSPLIERLHRLICRLQVRKLVSCATNAQQRRSSIAAAINAPATSVRSISIRNNSLARYADGQSMMSSGSFRVS